MGGGGGGKAAMEMVDRWSWCKVLIRVVVVVVSGIVG